MEYFDNLNYHEIDSPYIMDNFLRTSKTKDYNTEILQIINKFGFLPNLILLHINQSDYFTRPEVQETIINKLFNQPVEKINVVLKYFKAYYIKKFLLFLIGDAINQNFDKVSQLIVNVLLNYFDKSYDDNYPEEYYKSVIRIFNLCNELKLFDNIDYADIASIWEVIASHRGGKSIDLKLELTAIVSGCVYPEIETSAYILAYKGLNKDGSSTMCDWVTYESGKTYQATVTDSNPYNENSFGLSAWSYSKAKNYCSELVIPVRILKTDIKFLDIKTGKIRCSKFTVLENSLTL